MLALLNRRTIRFPELSYASPSDPPLKRWLIRSVEGASGRDRYAALYDRWRREIAPTGNRVFGRMLELIDVTVDRKPGWPPLLPSKTPLVVVANHPYGIGDGLAALAMAEELGRPFRVMIHAGLLKVPEMAAYSLPIDFSESKEAVRNNIAVRHEALRLIKQGVTIVIFPAGGVATAPRGFGEAVDLPWKMFPARLIQEARATVIPVHFDGQNGRMFHLASQVSSTLRLSLLIREFARLSGRRIEARVGRPLHWNQLAEIRDRKVLTQYLYDRVFELAPARWPELPSFRSPRGSRVAA